jgi:ribonuclease VapC
MFVDASAIVAMMTNEDDAGALSARLMASGFRMTSPMAMWETSLAYSRIARIEPEAALREARQYIEPLAIEVLPVAAEIATLAVEAHQRFGKGRHPAGLNFGDCFAYACAKQLGMPLLYKGDDFAQTDIEAA